MIRRLLDRRVPQFVALYVAGGWGFVQFVDWAVEEYLLAPALTTFVAVLLLLFIPTVVVIAWRHGAPGRDSWRRSDAAAIALNVAGAAAVLFFAFRGQELGAMTTLRLVEDAEGDTVQRVVPKAEFRRSVLLYDFDNETGDSDLDWLEDGFAHAVEIDLLQDVFLTPESSDGPTVRERLTEEGFGPGEEIPLALKHAAAQQRGTGHFVDGTFMRDGDSLLVRTRLYETRTGRQVASRDYRTTGPLEVADRISLDLRKDLGIPEGQIDQSVDLPAAELLTDDVDAYRAYVEASQQGGTNNDPAGALATAERAVALDSTFAAAHVARMWLAVVSGDQATAAEAAVDVNRFDYRLPERIRLHVQVSRGLIEGDPDGAIQAAKFWTELYPQDLEARRMLAMAYAQTGDRAGQIREYRALLTLDPTDIEATRFLGSALSQQGYPDSALTYRRRLIERRPGDLTARLDLASTLQTLGRYEEARDALEQAAVVAPDAPEVPRQLAYLDMRAGDYESAGRHLEEVRQLARTPQQRERRAALEETYYYRLGQFSRLEAAYRDRLALLAEIHPPIAVPSMIADSEFLLYAAQAGREEEALARVDSLRETAEFGFDLGIDQAAVRIHLDRGDFDAARSSLDRLERQVEMRGASDGRLAYAAWVRGRIAELEAGDCAKALGHFDRARELVPTSSLYPYERLRCLTRLERWKEAEEEVDWLLQHDPGHPRIQVMIARYHAARGRVDRALDQLDAALATWADADADYAPAREARELRNRLRGGD